MTLPSRVSTSLVTLAAANAIPLVGVLFFGWDLAQILILFWAETVVIGFFTFWKILLSKKIDDREAAAYAALKKPLPVKPQAIVKVFFLLFFPVHFGFFMLGHAFFLTSLFGSISPQTFTALSFGGIGFSLLSLFVSHLISFFTNYIGKKEYLQYSPQALMVQPYKRVMIMHITVLLGGLVVSFLGSPVYAIAFLVLIKTVFDISSHTKEHAPDTL